MRRLFFLVLSVLLVGGLTARDVVEEEGGFRYSIPDSFEMKENPRKSMSPQTQFATAFSRSTGALLVPSGWESAPFMKAVDATIQMAAGGFDLKVTEREEHQHYSESGVGVSVFIVKTEGEFPYLLVMAFSLDGKGAITYTLVPGEMSKEDSVSMVLSMVSSIEKL